jgi:peptide deformylase
MNWEKLFDDLEKRSSRGIDVVSYPHPALRHKAVEVQVFNDELRKLSNIMFDKMYDRKGCGLAAPQLGFPFQLFVINPTGDPAQKDKEGVFVNPIIVPKISRGRTRTYREMEGCLSVAGLYRAVDRPHDISYDAYDLDGKKFSGTYAGLTARIVQHENDHLHGVLFTDIIDDIQKQGVPEWLNYLTAQFESFFNFETPYLPPIDQIKDQLVEMEKLVLN